MWLSGMTAGLSFLHDRGIVHRDLKPANVFSDQDIVKVGDVGLSKYISESRRSAQTQSVGTVYYMAPEVCHGRYGKEVDVYAMGIMLVEMLTGHVPFDGETTAEILMKHMTAEPDLSGVPEKLRGVISAALEKDPEQRIQDVDELERQFRAALDGTTAADFNLRRKPSSSKSKNEHRPKTTVATAAVAAAPATKLTADSLLEQWTNLPVAVKWIVGGIAAMVLLQNGVLRYIPSGAFLGLSVYLGYRVFTFFFAKEKDKTSAPKPASQPRAASPVTAELPHAPQMAAAPVTSPRSFPPRSRKRRHHHHAANRFVCYTPATLRLIPKRQRMSDLTNSLSVSLAATFLVTLAVYLTTSLLTQPAHAVFFGAVTMLGSWALIVPGKLSEGKRADVFLRRATHGAIGLGVGFLAYSLQNYLMLSQDSLLMAADSVGEPWRVGRFQIADGSGYPTMEAFMLFFGGLFAARRWWWQADSFRRSRFRISSTLVTLLVGAVVAGVLQFPGALGATWALALSAVVQLSAGWTPQEERMIPEQAPDSMQPADVAQAATVQERTPVATV
jgi:serine/threonine protein kinase